MTGLRRKLDAALKVQVVLEAIRGKRTITEIASEYGVHPNENYCPEEVRNLRWASIDLSYSYVAS